MVRKYQVTDRLQGYMNDGVYKAGGARLEDKYKSFLGLRQYRVERVRLEVNADGVGSGARL